jgi:hypothetical protein
MESASSRTAPSNLKGTLSKITGNTAKLVDSSNINARRGRSYISAVFTLGGIPQLPSAFILGETFRRVDQELAMRGIWLIRLAR